MNETLAVVIKENSNLEKANLIYINGHDVKIKIEVTK